MPKTKFIEIMSRNSFELGQTDICKYLKIMAGYKFVYKKISDSNYKLYCFNGNHWEPDDILFKHFISLLLYCSYSPAKSLLFNQMPLTSTSILEERPQLLYLLLALSCSKREIFLRLYSLS